MVDCLFWVIASQTDGLGSRAQEEAGEHGNESVESTGLQLRSYVSCLAYIFVLQLMITHF
jgi:hypothetical protein